ncbi:MAG: EMC3/TMCO1 family protein [Candidatus Nitrosotenuis sp.]
MEPIIILQFLESIFLQGDFFGIRQGPLGSADPIVKGTIPAMFGILGFSILLNLFNAVVRRKLVDQEKLQRIMKETRAWQKERMAAFRAKDSAKQAELDKKSAYMTRLNQEMMQMNMRPMMITFVPLILIFYFVLPPLFPYIVAVSPISLNVIPGDFFQLTCTAESIQKTPNVCHNVNDVYFWAWYFLGSIAFSGIIMKITKTSMDLT